MKKYTIAILAIISSIAIFTQVPALSYNFGSLIIMLLASIAFFVIYRELVCWYYKIMIAYNEKKIYRLKKELVELKKIHSDNKEIITDR